MGRWEKVIKFISKNLLKDEPSKQLLASMLRLTCSTYSLKIDFKTQSIHSQLTSPSITIGTFSVIFFFKFIVQTWHFMLRCSRKLNLTSIGCLKYFINQTNTRGEKKRRKNPNPKPIETTILTFASYPHWHHP